MTTAPHVTVNGVPGISYTRRTVRKGQILTGSDQRRYVVTDVRDDGELYGDGSPCFEAYTELAPENLRVCQDAPLIED